MAKLDLIEAFQPSCRICRNLKNKIYKKKLSYLPTVNSDTLRESAKRCRYCRLIYDSIATVFDREFSQIEIHNWPTASKTLMLELGTGPTHGSLWPNKELLELFIPYGVDPPCKSLGIGKARDVLPESFSEVNIDLILYWLDSCNSTHNTCEPPYLTSLPTRILDLSSDHTHIKLIEPNFTAGYYPYTALSHCWGSEQNFTTTHSTLNERRNSIHYRDLPKTFRDAIQVTRAIGLRYLWIDSLCIIQDDQQDWEKEASKMGNIYRDAYLTIVAARAASDVEGFLSERTGLQGKDVDFTVDSHGKTAPGVKARLASAHYVALEEPIFKRGWVLQEQLLSPRSVRFCSAEMEWECRISHWCECASFQQFPRLAKDREVGNSYALSEAKVKVFLSGTSNTPQYIGTDFWRRHVLKEYGNRRLTKFSDALPALSAIAKRIQDVTGDIYCAGLWKSTLEDDLCWYNHTGSSVPSLEHLAPSWSWASIGASNFRLWPRLHDYEKDIVRVWIHEVECTPAGLNKFGNVSYGSVLISGGLAQAELLVEKQELEPGSNDPSTPKYSIIWDSSMNVPKGRNQKEIPGNIFYPDVVPLTPARARINGNMKPTFCRRNTTNTLQPDRKSDRGTVFCLLMKEYFETHFIGSKYDGDRLIRVFLVLTPSAIFEDSYERIGFYVDQTSPVGWEKMRDLSLRSTEKITIV